MIYWHRNWHHFDLYFCSMDSVRLNSTINLRTFLEYTERCRTLLEEISQQGIEFTKLRRLLLCHQNFNARLFGTVYYAFTRSDAFLINTLKVYKHYLSILDKWSLMFQSTLFCFQRLNRPEARFAYVISDQWR